jgi:hypothetical protein
MNERTQMRLAWALSASLLTAGWLSRYLHGPDEDHPLACAETTPRAVALVVGGDEAEPKSGDRVYVYWLDASRAPSGWGSTLGDAAGRAPGEASASPRWSFAGSAVLGAAPDGSDDQVDTSQIPNLSPELPRP